MRLFAIGLALGVALGASTAFAQEHPPTPSTTEPTGLPAPWDTDDPAELMRLFDRAVVRNQPGQIPMVSTVLLRGVPPNVAASGLEAIQRSGRAEGSEAVLRFLSHRRPTLRRYAVAAAWAIHTPAMVRAIESSLGDPSAAVREHAARALGEIGDAHSVTALWQALEHDVDRTLRPEGSELAHRAAVSIARRGTPEDITRLLTFMQRASFTAMSEALQAALARTDVPDPIKVNVINAVGNLATPDARTFLTDFARTAPRSPLGRQATETASHIQQ